MNSKTKALVEPDGGSKGIVSAKAAGSAAQNGKNLPGLLSACFSWLAVKSLLFPLRRNDGGIPVNIAFVRINTRKFGFWKKKPNWAEVPRFDLPG
jgi:hypothetical protein